MKLKSIHIRRTESYQTPSNTIVGTVEVVDEGEGAQTVTLSPQTINRICNLIRNEFLSKAHAQAAASAEAFDNAIGELELRENPMLSVSSEEPDF